MCRRNGPPSQREGRTARSHSPQSSMVKHALSGAKGKEKGPGGTASASSGAGSLPPYNVRISIANSRERIKMTRRPTLGGVRPGPAHGPTRYAGGPSTAVCARDAAVTSRCLRAMCDRRRSALLPPQDAIKRGGDAIGESRNSDLPSSPAPRRRAPSAGLLTLPLPLYGVFKDLRRAVVSSAGMPTTASAP